MTTLNLSIELRDLKISLATSWTNSEIVDVQNSSYQADQVFLQHFQDNQGLYISCMWANDNGTPQVVIAFFRDKPFAGIRRNCSTIIYIRKLTNWYIISVEPPLSDNPLKEVLLALKSDRGKFTLNYPPVPQPDDNGSNSFDSRYQSKYELTYTRNQIPNRINTWLRWPVITIYLIKTFFSQLQPIIWANSLFAYVLLLQVSYHKSRTCHLLELQHSLTLSMLTFP